MPPIEAPYKGKPAPATAENADAPEMDKPRTDEPTIPNLTADKHNAPPEETETDDTTEQIERLTDEATPDGEVDANLILMRADYTKKTQAVKDKERAIEARERQLNERYGVYEQVDRILADNPALASTHTVQQLVALVQSGQTPEAGRGSALSPEVRAELTAMRREVQETKQSLFADRAESAVRRVAAQYRMTQKETEALVKTAVDRRLLSEDTPPEDLAANLDLVAKALTADRAKTKGQQELVTKLKEKQKAASAGTSSAAPSAEVTHPARHKGWAGLIAKHQRQVRAG